jgi:endoglucanase
VSYLFIYFTPWESASTRTHGVDVIECEQPNYQSKNGRLFAVFKSGKEIQLDIKGVNWMGMQDKMGVPKGLWDNSREGSTIYRVGQFLSGNGFNAVRLPLSIDSAFRNVDIVTTLINTNSQRALTATRYVKLLGQIVQGLGQFGLGVVLDFHVLSAIKPDDSGLWYGESIQIDDIKTTITNMTAELCNSKHFNIIGIDLKDGIGKTASWGDGTDTDWAAAATTLAEHLVKSCPKWVAFVQGVQGDSHFDTFEGGAKIKNKFWAGSDLSGVAKMPIKISAANKLVYSPKYWSSAFLPQPYFFDGGTPQGEMLADYKESSDATLRKNVQTSMKNMFGPAMESGAAVILSSFGGLMGTEDLTKMKTSTRILQAVIEEMLQTQNGLAGGFWYTLNPETSWPYPAPNISDPVNSGLVDTTWRAANQNVLKNLKSMDTMASIQTIPCVTA